MLNEDDETDMDDNWLHSHLVQVVRAGLCTKILCTTCGAVEFRRGLLDSLAKATGKTVPRVLDQEFAADMLCALAKVRPDTSEERDGLAEPVQCILFDLWRGGVEVEPFMAAQLSDSWAGEVLARMKAHYDATLRARRALEEFNDPVNVQKRRNEAKLLRQQRHAIRLENKKERDRIWRFNNPKSDS